MGAALCNYTLLGERDVKAARKPHRCIWCGELIEVGSPYTYERSIFEGEAHSNHWHLECLKAMRDDMQPGECYYFDSWQMKRGEAQPV